MAVAVVWACAGVCLFAGSSIAGSLGGGIGGAIYGWGAGINVKHHSEDSLSEFIVKNTLCGVAIGGLYDSALEIGRIINGKSTLWNSPQWSKTEGLLGWGLQKTILGKIGGEVPTGPISSELTVIGKGIKSAGKMLGF